MKTTRERFDAITDYIRKHGVSEAAAAKAMGEYGSFYSSHKKRFLTETPKKARKKRTLKTDFIDIPLNTTTEEQKIALIVTTPSQIAAVLEGLWK